MTEVPSVYHNKQPDTEPVQQQAEQVVYEEAPETYTIPEQQTPKTAAEAYPGVLHDAEPQKKSKLKLILGAVGLSVTVAAVTGVVMAGAQKGKEDIPNGAPLPTSPGVSAEQVPGTTVSTPNTADTYGASPEKAVSERVRVNGKDYSIDEAREQLFTISTSDAPTFDAAVTKYLATIQTAMNMNTDRDTISDAGNSKKAVADMDMDLLTGDDSILLALGSDHNKVNVHGNGKRLEPGTLAYHENVKNINNETNSELLRMPGGSVTGNDATGYRIITPGFVTKKEQGSGVALDSVKYQMEIHGKVDPATGKWQFNKTTFIPYGS